jgi:hypothetical protein
MGSVDLPSEFTAHHSIDDLEVSWCQLSYTEYVDADFATGRGRPVALDFGDVRAIRVQEAGAPGVTAIMFVRAEDPPVELVVFSSAAEVADAVRRLWSACRSGRR